MTPDERLLGLALALGRRNGGLTWPNPSVGAVVTDPDRRILATAATAPGGRPHAEPPALRAAGDAARGGTLYVSLEPCSHHGRTPPCTDAIIASGVARVVTAVADPDPRVAGRGHALLRAAGIAVDAAVAPAAGERAHRGHFTRVRLGRPYVTIKLATTADGYAGRLGGGRLLITEEGANARTHMLRAHADAVAVGIGTVLADDPSLTVRLPGLEGRVPVRVVLDSRLRLPLSAGLVRRAGDWRTWVLCGEDAERDAERRLADAGVQVLRVPPPPPVIPGLAGGESPEPRPGAPPDETLPRDGTSSVLDLGSGLSLREPRNDEGVDLPAALRLLADRGLTHILCEGGPALADALAAHDLVDEFVLIRSDRPIDAGEGVPAIGPALAKALTDRVVLAGEEQVGPDCIRTYERRQPCSPAS